MLLISFTSLGIPGVAGAETIFSAIHSVTKSHPAVAAASKLIAAANSDRKEAVSGYMPTISLDGRVGRESRDRTAGYNSLDASELSMSLRQPLFDGFKTRSMVAAADASAVAAAGEMELRTLRVAFEAAKTYLDVLRANELATAAAAYRRRIDELAGQIGERADMDAGLRSNVTLGQSRQMEAEIQLTTAEHRRQLALDRFRELFARMPTKFEKVELSRLNIPATSEQALQLGHKMHPSIKAAHAATARQLALTEARRSDLLPRVDLEVSGRAGNNLDGVQGRDNSLFAGVRLSFKFETGGGAQHRIDSSNHRMEAALDDERDTVLQLRDGILEAWSEWRIADEVYRSVLNRRDNATRMVADYQGQFEAGSRELLDFFFVLTEQQTAVQSEINARHDRLLGAFKLVFTMGLIPKA